MISNHSEGTFGRLRYTLGGDRPSQTAHLTLSPRVDKTRRLEFQYSQGGIPPAPPAPKLALPGFQWLPPILYKLYQKFNIRLQQSSTGSFRPVAGNLHLHRYYNFTESLVETVPKSLHLSCGSELTRQGISLP